MVAFSCLKFTQWRVIRCKRVTQIMVNQPKFFHIFCFHFLYFQVVHIFSHINQTYEVYTYKLSAADVRIKDDENVKWMNMKALMSSALPTAMLKVSS